MKKLRADFALKVRGLTYVRILKYAISYRRGSQPSELYRQRLAGQLWPG